MIAMGHYFHHPLQADVVRLFLSRGALQHATRLALDALGQLDGAELIDGALQVSVRVGVRVRARFLGTRLALWADSMAQTCR